MMCRNIKPLFNLDPPVADAEIHDAALQYVRKISGFRQPSKTNEAAYVAAVEAVAAASARLLVTLETPAAPKDRQQEAAKAKARSVRRFGSGRIEAAEASSNRAARQR